MDVLVLCVRASVKQAGATGCSFVSRCRRLWTAMEMPREGFGIGTGSVMKREGRLVSLVCCAEVCLLVWGVATHGEDKSRLHGGWQRKGCMHGVYLELLVVAGLLV